MDDYTPFGYLDNPRHAAALHPSGVLRSEPALGFAWHYPAFPGPYVRQSLYRAALRVAMLDRGQLILKSEDFARHGIRLASRVHSQHITSFDWQTGGLVWSASFFLDGEHALCCRLRIANGASAARAVEWAFLAEYQRHIGVSNAWDCGLLARYRAARGAIALQAYPEGESFVLRASSPPFHHAVARSTEDIAFSEAPLPLLTVAPDGSDTAAVAGALCYRATIAPRASVELLATLARGRSETQASRTASRALVAGPERYAICLAAANEFRDRCPQLSGDWPDHWRHGMVYDFQTLRTVARLPLGRFRHPWDGMQIQWPRLVLAEAALDALVLGYAAPDLAQELLLGAFLDSRAPNVPCCREDGSHNMVSEDGEACGTAPEWCFPIYCADLLYRRGGDRAWLARLYPRLARYLEWWLKHRADPAGRLHYHCSWESGQDDSPRFGPQSGGGSSVEHVRPVDLHAAVAQGAAILSRFAAQLDRPRSAARWEIVARRYANMARSMFHEGWFRDFDARAGRWSEVRDVMHLAPLLAGLAGDEQRAALRGALADLPPHGIWPPLDWPPVVFTALEAVCAAGWHDQAGALAAQVVDRVYRASDAREHAPGGPLPGIAHERWASTGSWGCEGYGWGALTALLVIRHIAGWHEAPDGAIDLCPALPAEWLVPGRVFSIAPLRHRGHEVALSYRCAADGIVVSLQGIDPGRVTVYDTDGQPIAVRTDGPLDLSWKAEATDFHIEID